LSIYQSPLSGDETYSSGMAEIIVEDGAISVYDPNE
jgi:hypothetical protein